MTQEDKDLLLKDLCARLPYGVKCHVEVYRDEKYSGIMIIKQIDPSDTYAPFYCTNNLGSLYLGFEECKPYLFPLSSMTDEQKEELDKYFDIDSKSLIDGYKNGLRCPHPYFNVQDWYNKNHFDYRGLIPMGMANDATGLNIY